MENAVCKRGNQAPYNGLSSLYTPLLTTKEVEKDPGNEVGEEQQLERGT